MALFCLTYDLVNERDYQKLYDELDNYGAIETTESQWFFKATGTNAKKLREHFQRFIDDDDRLMVLRVANIADEPAWSGIRLLASPNDL